MQHLLIVCHPRRRSFTHAVARAYAEALQSLGHEVVMRDLYRIGFDPALSERELAGVEKPLVPAAVRGEQKRLAAAGALAFFYPIWWGYMPAMLKGYIDRVFAAGVAYDMQGDETVPLLVGKKALVFTCSGADMAYLRRSKQWNAMRTLEEKVIFAICGVALLDHVNFPSIGPDLEARTSEKHLAAVRAAAQRHWGAAAAAVG
jgi:NAD(P)H dehydrogenase (quinone)